MDRSEVLTSINGRVSLRRTKFLQAFAILSSDSGRDINSKKDDVFETIATREQAMISLMTKDSFLLQSFWQLKDSHETIRVNSLSGIEKVGNRPFEVIIDAYRNHILGERAIRFLEKLDTERIIVLTSYHISELKAKAPTYFVNRKESIKNLLGITYDKYLSHKSSQLCFSHNQSKIMQLILKDKNESNITSVFSISQQALKVQKFNIMYKLKLRRMSDIVTLDITSYSQ